MNDLTDIQPSRAEFDLVAPGVSTVSEFTKEVFTVRYGVPLWRGNYTFASVSKSVYVRLADSTDNRYLIRFPRSFHSAVNWSGTMADWTLDTTTGFYRFGHSGVTFEPGDLIQFGDRVWRVSERVGQTYRFANARAGLPVTTTVTTQNPTITVQRTSPLELPATAEDRLINYSRIRFDWEEIP